MEIYPHNIESNLSYLHVFHLQNLPLRPRPPFPGRRLVFLRCGNQTEAGAGMVGGRCGEPGDSGWWDHGGSARGKNVDDYRDL